MAADQTLRGGSFYQEVTAPATFDGAGQIADVGFVANHWKFYLKSGTAAEISFDGQNVHGTLGPSGTLPVELETFTPKSRVWIRGASSPVVAVHASIS